MSLARAVVPGRTYMITRRCSERRFFLRPDAETNNAFIYCLGVAALKYGVRVIFTSTMSNHHHTGVLDVEGRLPDFLAHFHKLLAKHQNALRGRWEALSLRAGRLGNGIRSYDMTVAQATAELDEVREDWRQLHDRYADLQAGILAFVARRFGESAVEDCYRSVLQPYFDERYTPFDLTKVSYESTLDRNLYISLEAMRGHLVQQGGGPDPWRSGKASEPLEQALDGDHRAGEVARLGRAVGVGEQGIAGAERERAAGGAIVVAVNHAQEKRVGLEAADASIGGAEKGWRVAAVGVFDGAGAGVDAEAERRGEDGVARHRQANVAIERR